MSMGETAAPIAAPATAQTAAPTAGLARVGLGVGLCIAATEVQRYAVLWRVGIGSPEERYTWLLVFIALGFAGLALLRRSGRELFRCTPAYALVALVACAGVVARSVLTWQGGALEDGPVRMLVGLAMEAPYFLMAFWANYLLRRPARFAMKAVALGIVFAGAVQMLVSLLAGSVVSYAIAALLAPAAAASLWSLTRRGHATAGSGGAAGSDNTAGVGAGTGAGGEAEAATVAEVVAGVGTRAAERTSAQTAAHASTLLVLMGALIVCASMVVYIIHAQWTGIQDGGSASLLVQVCTGAGMLVAGGVLYLASERLVPRDLFDFCFILVLPSAVAGLYLAMATDGAMLAVSVVPLNIVYATLLFFVWTVPFICAFDMDPGDLSLLAFFLKRAGVLVCPLVMGVFEVLGVGLAGLVFGSIVALIALDAAYYLVAHGDRDDWGGRGDRSGRGGQGCQGEGPAGPWAGGALAQGDTAIIVPSSPHGMDGNAAACGRIAQAYALTPRESEVLTLLGRGRTARHIGRELGMSDATVKTHISHIYRKLGVNSQQELLDLVEKG